MCVYVCAHVEVRPACWTNLCMFSDILAALTCHGWSAVGRQFGHFAPLEQCFKGEVMEKQTNDHNPDGRDQTRVVRNAIRLTAAAKTRLCAEGLRDFPGGMCSAQAPSRAPFGHRY